MTAVKMSSVVLPCHAQGQPKPTVSWTKGGAKLATRGGSYRVLPTGKSTGLSSSLGGIGQHRIRKRLLSLGFH